MIDFKEEYLLHMVVVDDAIATKLGITSEIGYLRAFVVKNRKTGELRGLVRFNQPGGKSWSEICGQDDPQNLVAGIVKCLTLAANLAFPDLKDPVTVYTPPRPDLSPNETVAWLLDEDLIEIQLVEPGMKITGRTPDGAL